MCFLSTNRTVGRQWFGGAAGGAGGHAGMGYVIKGFLLAPLMTQQEQPLTTTPNNKDLAALTHMIEAGKVTPVIDRTFLFNEISAALGYVAQGHARGKVVVMVYET